MNFIQSILLISLITLGSVSKVISQEENKTKLVSKYMCYKEGTNQVLAANSLMVADGGDMKSFQFTNTEYIAFIAWIREESGKLKRPSFSVTLQGLSGCGDKGNTLEVIFEGGDTIRLVNWKDFDCKRANLATAYMDFNDNQLELLKTKKITGVSYSDNLNNSITCSGNMRIRHSVFFMNIFDEYEQVNKGEMIIRECVPLVEIEE
jgi:hypothetical protein